MIIQSKSVSPQCPQWVKNGQVTVDNGHSSENIISYGDAQSQLNYYIVETVASSENLAGEEVVIIRNDDSGSFAAQKNEFALPSDISFKISTNFRNVPTTNHNINNINNMDNFKISDSEVQQAVLSLQPVKHSSSSSSFSLNSNNLYYNNAYNDNKSRKRKAATPIDIEAKRKKSGVSEKFSLSYPLKNGMATVNNNNLQRNSRSFNNDSSISNSIINGNNNNGKAIFKCPICEKTFETDKYLSMHLSLHKYSDTSRQPLFDPTKQDTSRTLQHQLAKFNGDVKVSKASKKIDVSMVLPLIDGTPNGALVASKIGTSASSSTATVTVTTSTNGQWLCPYCHKVFVQNSNFKNHVRTHSDERPFVCDICSIGFKERYHLKKHVLFKHTNDLKETCRVCGKRFKDSTAVRAHERIHSEVRPYGCTLCGKTFKTSECLWHHENRSKTCGKAILAKQQQQQQNRQELIGNAQTAQQFNGIQTGVVLAVQPQKRQRRSKLANSLQNKSQSKGNKSAIRPIVSQQSFDNSLLNADNIDLKNDFEDAILDEMWANLTEVENSQDSDENSDNLAIQLDYKTKENYTRETSSVTNPGEDRPYKCKLCDNAFKLKVHLKKHHLYRHTSEYPCECSICGKRFKDTSAVRLHERIHSSDRPFKCGCGKSFKTRENLWGHKNRGPCDSRAANQSANAFLTGKMRLYKSQEFGTIIGVPIEDANASEEQNPENMVRIEFVDGVTSKIQNMGGPIKTEMVTATSTGSVLPLNDVKPNGTTSAAIFQPSNPGMKTTTIKVIKTPHEPSLQSLANCNDVETSIALSSSMNIPTAIVTPIQRSQANFDSKKTPGSSTNSPLLQTFNTKTNSTPSNSVFLSNQAKNYPAIQSLLVSNKDRTIHMSCPTTPNGSALNMLSGSNYLSKESRVLKVFGTPNDTITILIPPNSSQQLSLIDFNKGTKNETTITQTNVKQESLPTMNNLLTRDSVTDFIKIGENTCEYLADSEVGDIFDFKVGDATDSALFGLKDAVNCQNNTTLVNVFDDIGQPIDTQYSSLDDIYSVWSNDNWPLDGEEALLEDLKLPDSSVAAYNNSVQDFLV